MLTGSYGKNRGRLKGVSSPSSFVPMDNGDGVVDRPDADHTDEARLCSRRSAMAGKSS